MLRSIVLYHIVLYHILYYIMTLCFDDSLEYMTTDYLFSMHYLRKSLN